MEEFMLTTIDNPYNPFVQFEEWFAFDVQKGYHTCSYLARVAKSSDELTETEESEIINDAIDEIVRLNVNGKYRKVKRSDFTSAAS